ncbi:hypothetical protein F5Y18DRAFT_433537 [Xylariaceae sp. FL1019]|nr:hypothetical protein F5Y18DRAFT_433537 [Xylariaceae sp. FL1019]
MPALQTIRNVVLLFNGPQSSPSATISNVTAISSQFAYEGVIPDNITTLTDNYVSPQDGLVRGLLYVPDLDADDPCNTVADQYIPSNVTRQKNLPDTDYKLIALAPWISVNCTRSFFRSARVDPIRAMLVYQPDAPDGKPPNVESADWDLDDGGAWKESNHFPVYAVPSSSGKEMMFQLSQYSGNISSVPFAEQISETYSPKSDDYIRVWSELSISRDSSDLPIWALVLIIVGTLLVVIGGTSLGMHYVQNRRRAFLRHRVMNGEVNLEALGIKRLRVPLSHVRTFPLFTYHYDPSSTSTIPKVAEDTGVYSSSQVPAKQIDRLDHQPTCLICLDDFESNETVIRELPCGHIYHPDCIDPFLSRMSSLCPSCKASMLPLGFSPKITNSMARRELNTRKLRSNSRVLRGDIESRRRWVFSSGSRAAKDPSRTSAATELTSPAPVLLHTRGSTIRHGDRPNAQERMEELVPPVDERNSDDGRPPWKRAALTLFPGFS